MSRKKRKNKSNYYFTQVHEDAIVKYAESKDQKEREKLYSELIAPALSKLVDKIVITYKFTNLPNVDSLKEDCKNWLTTILDKYDQDRGFKAFSYYSVITKNWFIHKVKKHSTKLRREVNYDDMSKKVESEQASTQNDYLLIRDEKERWQDFFERLESWGKEEMKPNERKVYEAICVLFDNRENIEIFNKKAVYLYFREITGLSTKQIVNSLQKFRDNYKDWKFDWNNA